ncbi:fibronectin type III domain-containing protein [Nonlabens tegetincola]|uniref:fibronectin type III domain-containing protein n=1 Tax=Nonlabens tegetincola TaxID=323273 RepID=UPI0030C885E9
MRKIYLLLSALLITFAVSAQCNYTLELTDNLGNDWVSGGNLTANTGVDVTVAGTTTTYAIQTGSANPPAVETYSITVNDGDALVIDYRPTQFPGDGTFRLLDSEGILVYDAGFNNSGGMAIFSGNATCPTCPAVSNITAGNVVADSAEIAWTAGGSETSWIIEYGISPYTCGSGGTQVTVNSNPATLSGLSSVTSYDVYVIADCGNGDFSACQGPVTFTTTESCPSASNFAPVTNTSNSISFVWDSNGNPNPVVNIEYALQGVITTPGTGQGTVVQQFTAPFADVTGLASDTCYDFFVQIDCGAGDLSLWSGPYQACTLISCFPVSSLESVFVGPDSADISWSAGQTGSTEWEINYAPVGTITTPFDSPAQGTVVTSNSANYSITSLTPDTEYDVYVREVCDPNLPDYSTAEQITVFTQCLPLTATTAMPYVEDFESFTGTTNFSRENCWSAEFVSTNTFSQYEWAVTTSGTTPSTGTGPDAANSGTNYMFTETLGSDGDTATLFSPIINVDGLTEPSVQFAYFLYGANMGSLSVDVWDGSAWQTGLFATSGQIQTSGSDPWENAIINLAGYTGDIQVRFVSTRAGFTTGDMAIDDFSIEEAPACAPVALLGTGVLNANDAEVLWTSQGSETSWIIEYGPTGFTPGTASTDPNVFEVTAGTNPFTLTGLMPNTAYDFYVVADCGSGTLSTQTGPATFRTAFLPPQGVTCPSGDNVFAFQEEFENNDNGWTGDIGVGTTTAGLWNFNRAISPTSTGTGPDAPFSGGGFAYLETSGTFTVAEIVSPAIDLSFATDGAELSFYYFAYGAEVDTFEVNVSNSPTGPWTNVFTAQGQLQTAGSDPWAPVGVNLDAYLGQTIYLQITGQEAPGSTGFAADIAIDLMRIETCGAFCSPPNQIALSNITDTTVDIDFNDTNATAASNFEYIVVPAGSTPPDATTSGTATSTTTGNTATGLTAFTDYDVYVRTDCSGAAGFSSWSGPVSFQTTCAAFAAPYFEGFEAFTVSTSFVEENCWSTPQTSGYTWDVSTGGTGSTNTGPLAAYNGNNYFFTEASSGTTGAVAELDSPLIDLSALTTPTLTFAYHMWGPDFDNLAIDINDGSAWILDVFTLTGQQQTNQADPWQIAQVDLSAYANMTIQIRFRGTRGTSFGGDISIDDVTVDELPTCPNVSDLNADSITSTEANLFWNENDTATSWEYEYDVTGFTQGSSATGVQTTSTNTGELISGLTPDTTYDYYVRSACPNGGFSNWVGPFSFTTRCAPLTAPYANDFESDPIDGLNNCESNLIVGSGTTAALVEVEDFIANSGSQHIYMYSGSPAATEIFWISPEFSDLSNDKRVKFQAYDRDTGGIEVGVMTDPTDSSTFTSVQTFANADLPDDQYELITVNFTSITTTGGFVAIKFNPFGAFDAMYIDDFVYEVQPSCLEPANLSTVAVADTTADLDWDAGATETEWDVVVGPVGFDPLDPATYAIPLVNVLTNSNVQVTGLTPETDYEFYVLARCGAGDESVFTGPEPFTTTCAAFTAPYFNGFENMATSTSFVEDDCWTASSDSAYDWNVDGSGSTPSTGTGPLNANTGSNYFYTEASSGAVGDTATLVTPLIDLSGLTTPSVEFFYHMFGGEIGTLDLEIYDGTSWTNIFTVGPGQQQTAQADPWLPQLVDLTAYAGQTVQFRFIATSNGTFEGDISIDDFKVDELPACPNPSVLTVANVTDASADLSWTENGSSTSWIVEYGPCGFTPGTASTDPNVFEVTATTNSNFVITGLTSETCYEFYVTADCGGGTLSNATGPGTFTTACSAFVAPYSEGFESFTVTASFVEENCWSTPQTSGYTWDVSTGGTGSTNTGPTAAATGSNYFFTEASSGSAGSEAELVSPLIDMTALTNPALSFAYHMWGPDFDTLHVDVNDGSGWDLDVFTLVGQQQVNQTDAWQTAIVPLGAYNGATISVRFRGTRGASFGGDIAIDDVAVEDFNGCLTPSNITVANITATTADVSWTAGGSETAWEYVVVTAGSGAPTGAGTSTTTTTVTESGLTASTSYEVYVRADCGMGNFSTWVGPITFSTACLPVTSYPYAADMSQNAPNTCWDEAGSGDIASGPSGLGTSDWRDSRAYTDINGTVVNSNALNLFQNVDQEWLISEDFDLSGTSNDELTIEVAVTDWTTSGISDATDTDTMGSDDQVDLLVSTDNGVTWTSLFTWTVANQPAVTGTREIIDISAYSGITRFAIYATDGAVDDVEDYDFHVGVFEIDAAASVDNTQELGFTYYPNPTVDVVNINAVNTIDSVTVTNLSGQRVVSLKPASQNAVIDLSTYSTGMYLIQVTSNGATKTVRVIKE